jgi:hypothetical protein
LERRVIKRIGFDFNPENKHVKQTGFQHLNLQTQFDNPNGEMRAARKGSPYHDPHIPVNKNDIRPGDYKTPPKKQ